MNNRLTGLVLTLLVAGIAQAQQPAPAAPAAAAPAAPAAAPAAPAAAPAAPAAKATGLAAWSMLVGNTITAKIDGHDHAEYYMENGSVKAQEGGSISTGKWAVEGTNVCFMYPRESKKCYTMEVDGTTATFMGKEGTFRGEISKGNAKKL